ncbi:hypothetical protein LBMAG53_33090 [Planctomycetota bacterium]|nr:hypothetical protein LBMAG53_33090 [Planctomycetota bacterium]
MSRSTSILSLALLAIAAAPAADDIATLEQRIQVLEKSQKDLLDRIRSLLDSQVVQEDVQGVTNSLESFKYQYQRDRETKSPVSVRGITITGGLAARYAATNRSKTSAGADGKGGNANGTASANPAIVNGRNNTFDVAGAFVNFSGSLYRDYAEGRNLTFNLRFDGTPQTGAAIGNSFANLTNANVVYSPLPTTSQDIDRLTITLGQQTLPFGLEANTTEELRPVINSAQFVGATGVGRREIGLVFRGDFGITYDYGYNYRSSLISYNFGLVNGNGPNRADDNDYKDIIARVDVKLPTEYNSWLRELRLGVSYYHGRQVIAGATNAAGALLPGASTYYEGARKRYGLDLYYNHFPFGFTYEFVRSVDDVAAGSSTTERRGNSHTATLFYSFGSQFLASQRNVGAFDDYWPKTWQPFVRFDRWDPDIKISGNHTDIYTVGLNAFFAETTKAQLNLTHKREKLPSGAARPNTAGFITNEIIAQLQYGF